MNVEEKIMAKAVAFARREAARVAAEMRKAQVSATGQPAEMPKVEDLPAGARITISDPQSHRLEFGEPEGGGGLFTSVARAHKPEKP